MSLTNLQFQTALSYEEYQQRAVAKYLTQGTEDKDLFAVPRPWLWILIHHKSTLVALHNLPSTSFSP